MTIERGPKRLSARVIYGIFSANNSRHYLTFKVSCLKDILRKSQVNPAIKGNLQIIFLSG